MQDGAAVAGPSHTSSGTVAGLANILAQSVAAAVGGVYLYACSTAIDL